MPTRTPSPETLAASKPSTMPLGKCRLCNTYGELTYEHVPPKVTFNKHTRFRVINFMDYVKIPNPLDTNFKGKTEQGGIGYYSLCRQCNNFLGSTYVPAYQRYSNSFIDMAKKKHFNAFEITMHDFAALKVLKHIISMFLSINDENFSENNRELSEFVLNPSSQQLSGRYRIFNYLNTEGQFRNIPICASGDLKTGGVILGSELAFPPLGHVLTIDFNGRLTLHHEITSFKEFGIEQLASVDIKVYRLPTHLPWFLDYRDKKEIIDTINKNLRPT